VSCRSFGATSPRISRADAGCFGGIDFSSF
jgi:hypothetical protein